MKTGAELIAEERQRQIVEEGWTPEHDDGYHNELAVASAWYALPHINRTHLADDGVVLWPWADDWFKPGDGTADGRIRELAKAGALIAAEIDRINRLGHNAD